MCVLAALLGGCTEVDGRVLARQGFQAYRMRDYQRAVNAYTQALASLPEHRILRRNLAYSHLAASRASQSREIFANHLDAAISLLRDAVGGARKDPQLAECLFYAWMEAGRLAEAARFFAEWAEREDSDEALRMLALVQAQRGQYAAALRAYKRRVELNPKEGGLYAAVATLTWEWLQAGGPEIPEVAIHLATEGYDAALKADGLVKDHPSALVYAGLLLRERAKRQSDPAQARADIRLAETMLQKMRQRAKQVQKE